MIYVETEASAVRTSAYDAIKRALSDPSYLRRFAPDVISAAFVRHIRDTLIVFPSEPEGSGTSKSPATTVAIAAAVISFVLLSIFAFGMFRRHKTRREGPPMRNHGMSPATLGIKRVNYFEKLEGDDLDSILFHVAYDAEDPSFTGSVSDITSDASSIKSSISRPNSPLERIEEESNEEVGLESESPPKNKTVLRVVCLSPVHDTNEEEEDADDEETARSTPTNEHQEPMISIFQMDSSVEDESDQYGIAENFIVGDDVHGESLPFSSIIEVETVTSDESNEHETGFDFSFCDIEEARMVDLYDTGSLDLSGYTVDSNDESMDTWLMKFLFELSVAQRTPRLEN